VDTIIFYSCNIPVKQFFEPYHTYDRNALVLRSTKSWHQVIGLQKKDELLKTFSACLYVLPRGAFFSRWF